jgi:hypothetical protein
MLRLLALALAALCITSAARAATGGCEYASASGCAPSYDTLMAISDTPSPSPIDG